MTLVTRKWTRAEYENMIEIGLLSEDERVELIRGEIVALSPIDPLHASAVDLANRLLNARFGETHVVRVQNPILAVDDSLPQPDLVVISAPLSLQLTRERRHPSSAELVIEVANTSLAYDRGEKGSLYAASGFALYWIVNRLERLLWLELRQFQSPEPGPDRRVRRPQPGGQRFSSAGGLTLRPQSDGPGTTTCERSRGIRAGVRGRICRATARASTGCRGLAAWRLRAPDSGLPQDLVEQVVRPLTNR